MKKRAHQGNKRQTDIILLNPDTLCVHSQWRVRPYGNKEKKRRNNALNTLGNNLATTSKDTLDLIEVYVAAYLEKVNGHIFLRDVLRYVPQKIKQEAEQFLLLEGNFSRLKLRKSSGNLPFLALKSK